MNISKSLKVALAMRGLKNIELAEKLGTSKQQVSNWIKTSTMKQSNLIQICEALEMPVSEFIALGEDK